MLVDAVHDAKRIIVFSKTSFSRVEKIPGTGAEPHELVLLSKVGFGAVPAFAKDSSRAWTAAKRGRAIPLVLCSWSPSPAGAPCEVTAGMSERMFVRCHALTAWRRRGWRLVPSIVYQLGSKLLSPGRHLCNSFLGGSVLTGPRGNRWGRALLWARRRQTRRWKCLALGICVGGRTRVEEARSRGASVLSRTIQCLAMTAESFVGENIGNRRQSILRLDHWCMMDVRGIVGGVPCQVRWLMAARKSLVEWSGLDDPLIRKLFVRRRNDGETRRGSLPGCHGSLQASAGKCMLLPVASAVRTFCILLQPCFDYLSLMLSYLDASLQLFLHARVLSLETGREAGQADVLHAKVGTVSGQGRRWPRRARLRIIVARGQIQLARTVSRGVWYFGRRWRLFLHNDLGRLASSRPFGGQLDRYARVEFGFLLTTEARYASHPEKLSAAAPHSQTQPGCSQRLKLEFSARWITESVQKAQAQDMWIWG